MNATVESPHVHTTDIIGCDLRCFSVWELECGGHATISTAPSGVQVGKLTSRDSRRIENMPLGDARVQAARAFQADLNARARAIILGRYPVLAELPDVRWNGGDAEVAISQLRAAGVSA